MKTIFLLTFFLVRIFSSFAQDVEGTWVGKLDLGGRNIRISFNLFKEADHFRATMDSPDQGVSDFPVTSVEVADGELIFVIEDLKFRYYGEFVNDTLVEGSFRQGNVKLPLNLVKGPKLRLNRPQEPKPPFDYIERDVFFTNSKANVTLAGTLTQPNKSGTFPAILLVSGSGAQNRNEEIFGHKLFLVLADFLTRSGFAVLRYDDRGFGGSSGNFDTCSTLDFLDDAISGLEFLGQQKGINKKKIGILGHSEGGTIAFMAGSQGKVSFAISLAGAAVSGDSILLSQNRSAIIAGGISVEIADAYVDLLRFVFNLLTVHSPSYINDNIDILSSEIMSYRSDILPESYRKNAIAVLLHDTVWLRYFRNNDPTKYLGLIRCPLLALNGDKDMQVDASINLGAIEHFLPSATVIRYSDLNHLFQPCTTGSFSEYGKIEQTISVEVLDDILDWLRRVVD